MLVFVFFNPTISYHSSDEPSLERSPATATESAAVDGDAERTEDAAEEGAVSSEFFAVSSRLNSMRHDFLIAMSFSTVSRHHSVILAP